MNRKNPLLAAILSLLIAGLGQLYLHKFFRAVVFLLLEVVTAGIWIYLSAEIGAIINLLVSVIAAYDAYKIAKEINRKPEKTDVGEIPEIYIN
ncbi:MAG: hypothetical protein U9Q22_08565 [Candidatus Altiarchaeota archaeon]|nr:hypothetical protein [Candidatus Altiarchaeota archaeon]